MRTKHRPDVSSHDQREQDQETKADPLAPGRLVVVWIAIRVLRAHGPIIETREQEPRLRNRLGAYALLEAWREASISGLSPEVDAFCVKSSRTDRTRMARSRGPGFPTMRISSRLVMTTM